MAAEGDGLCTKLLDIVKHTREADIELKCDVCSQNSVLVLCTNCAQCYYKVCHEQHRKEKNEHNIIPLNKASFCSEHNKAHEYYCEKCDQSVCSCCKVKHSNEADHHIGTIEEMASKHRKMLAEVTAPVDGISEALSKKEADLTHTQENLEKQLAEVQQSIDNQYEAQLKKLEEHYHQLKIELNEISLRKSKALKTYLGKVQSINIEVGGVKKLFEDLRNA